jgi:uncharacterized membrane protein
MIYTFQFSASWYLLFAAFLLGWLTIMLVRKKHFHGKEAKQQLLIGILGTVALASMEIFAVSTNLWNYMPANWPVILWPTYFVAILFGYQLLRVVEKIVPP